MRDHIGGGFHRYSVDARVAGAALREDALRPGAAGARLSRRGAGGRRRIAARGGGGHAALRDARDDRPGGRLLLGGGRRQHPARALRHSRRAQDGRRLLPVDGGGARCPARCGVTAREEALRHRTRRERSVRPAAGVRRQEPALRRAVDCRTCRRVRLHAGPDARRTERRPPAHVPGTHPAPAAAPRRQGADVVERADDRRVRARRPRAARDGHRRRIARHAVPRRRPTRRCVSPLDDVERQYAARCCAATAPARPKSKATPRTTPT